VKVRAAAATDIGMVRERNEDSYLVDEPLFAVADGMGGHLGGEVASRLAVETLERLFHRHEGELPDQIREANRAVFERSVVDRSVAGMGTTLTAIMAEGDRVRLAHVGDSRAYLLRDGALRLLTEDHTLVHRMVQEGEISEQEAEVHPQRNILTRVIGVDLWVEVDEDEFEVRPGDRILLCTDGLTGMVREDQIREILAAGREPRETAEELVRRANEAGGVDNITVVVLDIEEGDSEPPAEAPDVADPATSLRLPYHPPPGSAKPPGPPEASRARPLPWRRVALWGAVIVVLVVAAVVGTRMYLDRQWYVGVSDGNVAVFRGIPTSVAGFDLHHVVEETSIPADQAEQLALWQDLGQGITAEDRQSAEDIVEQIRRDVAAMPATTGNAT
jgi:protein phosphatase